MKHQAKKIVLKIYPILSVCFLAVCFSCIEGYAGDDDFSIDSCYVQEIDGNGKHLMHLEGTPYEMGYAMGYLRPNDVMRTISPQFFKGCLLYLLGSSGDTLSTIDIDGVVETMWNTLNTITAANKGNVPDEYLEEMQGIVDGVKAADPDSTLTFDQVFGLNVMIDQLLSAVYPLMVPLLPLSDLAMHSCNGFVAFGNATVDGRVLMGRDFMFSSEIYHEVALLVEYVPESGNRFVAVTCPGFVGVATAMNDKGIGIGLDMINAMNNNPSNIGMGCLLLARETIQYSSNIDEAVSFISDADRGVPWAFIIGDGSGKAAVVETSANFVKARYADYEQPFSFRTPDQIEDKDDLVVVSNHYLTPFMNLLGLSYASDDSIWRYDTLVNLLLTEYGTIDTEKGQELIDFLHPPNYGYYTGGSDAPVAASVSLFDLTNLEMRSLYGLYSDSWVTFKF